jgi:putative ABC transport system permease protein
MSTREVTFLLLALFSGLALTLAAIGIYGVMSYGVALRGRELSIRVALGARRTDVLRTVLAQGFFIAGAGIAIGVGFALALTRLMRALLFEVGASDPGTFLLVGGGVALCAALACVLPGWRALRVDPIVALRQQ